MKPTTLREAEYKHNVWDVDLVAGSTLRDALNPTFWSHVARRLRPRDRIFIHAADASFFAELMVRTAAPTAATVVVLRHVDLDKADKEAKAISNSATLKAVYRGPTCKWSVQREGDKAILVEKLETREAAEDWIKSPPEQAQAA